MLRLINNETLEKNKWERTFETPCIYLIFRGYVFTSVRDMLAHQNTLLAHFYLQKQF